MESECLVLNQSYSGGHIEPVYSGIFILQVKCCGPVIGPPSLYAHGGAQVIKAVLGTGTEQISVGQAEYALKFRHGALLVTLQMFLIREIWEIGGIVAVGVITLLKRGIRVVIVVCVAVPAYIQRDAVSSFKLVFRSQRSAGITVFHIKRVDIT